MDLGFGGFLEKFEDHFGRSATKALLAVIGVTVVALCGATIWTHLLKPVAAALPDHRPGSNLWLLAKLMVFAAFFMWLVNMMLNFADNYLARLLRRQLREKLAEARQLSCEGQVNLARAEAVQRQTADNLTAAQLAFEHAVETALQRQLITPEEADEIRSLTDDLSLEDREA